METKVVLVNENDEVLGTMEKLEAHQKGVLHRAFSVFLFNEKGQMLLQKRAATKYHSPNKWTNTCCSHPMLNETYQDAALRRLREELGIAAEIQPIFHFIYKADVGDGLWEHELDHVFIGNYEGVFQLNPEEVSEIRYITLDDLLQEVSSHPDDFTEWFKIILSEYMSHIKIN